MEGRGTTTITTIITITKVFFGRPQGVWKSEFPVGNSFLLRGTEKKTQTLKWSGKKETAEEEKLSTEPNKTKLKKIRDALFKII